MALSYTSNARQVMLSPRTLTKKITRVSLRWMDAFRMNSISRPSMTTDDRLCERQQPRAHFQFGVFRSFQIDFEANFVCFQ